MSWQDFIESILNKHKPQVNKAAPPTDKDIEYAVIPDGMTIKSLKTIRDEERTQPQRRTGTVKALDLASLIAVTNRFKSEHSALFQKAIIKDNDLLASLQTVFNYHPGGADNTAADNADHRVRYEFPLSEELKIWLGKNKTGFDQKEFAEFLEDNIADLVIADNEHFHTSFGDMAPAFTTPSKILELARGIDIRVEERVTQAFRTADGSFNLQYTSENKDAAGNKLNVPEWFVLGIPVFENGKYFQFPVRLRFRQNQGQVKWFFELYRKNDILRAALNDACDQAQKETELPLYSGDPES